MASKKWIACDANITLLCTLDNKKFDIPFIWDLRRSSNFWMDICFVLGGAHDTAQMTIGMVSDWFGFSHLRFCFHCKFIHPVKCWFATEFARISVQHTTSTKKCSYVFDISVHVVVWHFISSFWRMAWIILHWNAWQRVHIFLAIKRIRRFLFLLTEIQPNSSLVSIAEWLAAFIHCNQFGYTYIYHDICSSIFGYFLPNRR